MLDVDAMIDALTERPGDTAILVDFDGSLAPIVDRPDDAVPLPSAVEVLQRLIGPFGRVGIVSGRPIGFLVEHAGIPGLVLAGLYGMETLLDGEPRIREHAGSPRARTRLFELQLGVRVHAVAEVDERSLVGADGLTRRVFGLGTGGGHTCSVALCSTSTQ